MSVILAVPLQGASAQDLTAAIVTVVIIVPAKSPRFGGNGILYRFSISEDNYECSVTTHGLSFTLLSTGEATGPSKATSQPQYGMASGAGGTE